MRTVNSMFHRNACYYSANEAAALSTEEADAGTWVRILRGTRRSNRWSRLATLAAQRVVVRRPI